MNGINLGIFKVSIIAIVMSVIHWILACAGMTHGLTTGTFTTCKDLGINKIGL